jgi:lipid II:glycine glycyltransferase (peptidoglycan interpeptide bridge formation enzyme)
MVNWILVNDISPKDWDIYLQKFSNFDFYQSYNWGEYKKNYGWKPYRFIGVDSNNHVKAIAQCLYKDFPFSIGILYCPGGPLGDLSLINKDFAIICQKIINKKFLYIKLRVNHLKNKETLDYFSDSIWKESKNKLTNGLSMNLNIESDEDSLIAGFSKNWRRNLKRFKKSELIIEEWKNYNLSELILIYRDMESYKNIRIQYSDNELKHIFDYFKDQIIIYKCKNLNGEVISFRGAIIIGRKAFDFFAATHQKGRKLYPSNKLLWTLLLRCKEIGASIYDLSGIDPIKNPGGYNFKKGTGATEIESVGELEWSNSSIIKYLFNLAVKIKVI